MTNNLVKIDLAASTKNGTSHGVATIVQNSTVVRIDTVDLHRGTQPEAMYKLVIATLEYAHRVMAFAKGVPVSFELTVDNLTATQINGTAKCQAPNLLPLWARAKKAMEGLDVTIRTDAAF